MPSFLSLTNRRRGTVPGLHGSTTSTATTLSGDGSLRVSSSKSSLRDRFKGLKSSITRKSLRAYKHSRVEHVLDRWYDIKADDDLLCRGQPATQQANIYDFQSSDAANLTWPAIRKSISNIALSLRTSQATEDSRGSPGQESRQSASSRSKGRLRVSQEGVKRWAAMANQVPAMVSRHSINRARYEGFCTISELVSRRSDELAPQLPGLVESSSFLESLNNTGLFQTIASLSEDSTAETIKVQQSTAGASAGRPCPPRGRLPLRIKNPDINQTKGRRRSSRADLSGSLRAAAQNTDIYNSDDNTTQPQLDEREPGRQQTELGEQKPVPACVFSSKQPVEWLDRILETSHATRSPIPPKYCMFLEGMDFLSHSQTCIFVDYPLDDGVPAPLRYYPGFRAALEDVCDRFGHFYAPFAAYNAHTRTITLYAAGTPRPVHRFVDEDTAIFDLELARSAWVRVKEISAPKPTIATAMTTLETSDDDDATDLSRDTESSSDGTLVSHHEELEAQDLALEESWSDLDSLPLDDDSSLGDDAMDRDITARVDLMA